MHTIHCGACDVRAECLLSSVADGFPGRFKEERTTRHYRRGQVLFFQGDAAHFVFTVQSGTVKLFKTNGYDQEVVVRLLRPGALAGFRPALSGEPAALTSEAVEPTVVCMVPEAAFKHLTETSIEFARLMIRHLARELRVSEDFWFRQVTDDLEERVNAVLREMAVSSNSELPEGQIRVTLPRTEIARAVGVTPPTLSRILRKLSARGMVKLHARAIDVLCYAREVT